MQSLLGVARKTVPSLADLRVRAHPAQSLSVCTNNSLGAACTRNGLLPAVVPASTGQVVSGPPCHAGSATPRCGTIPSPPTRCLAVARQKVRVRKCPKVRRCQTLQRQWLHCLPAGASRTPSPRARRGVDPLPTRTHLLSSGQRGCTQLVTWLDQSSLDLSLKRPTIVLRTASHQRRLEVVAVDCQMQMSGLMRERGNRSSSLLKLMASRTAQ